MTSEPPSAMRDARTWLGLRTVSGWLCHLRSMSIVDAATLSQRGRPDFNAMARKPPAVNSKAAATKGAPESDSSAATYAEHKRHLPGSGDEDHHLANGRMPGRLQAGHEYMKGAGRALCAA